jgi:hypothetical protein
LVGQWSYQVIESGIEDVIIAFQPNGNYNQFVRFPNVPALGQQVVQVWGKYTLNGTTLTTIPAGSQVSGGTNPSKICNMQLANYCIPPDLKTQTLQLQPINDSSIGTPFGTATRIQ